jgi:hypothetical protein
VAVSGGKTVVYRPGDIVSFRTSAAVNEGRLVAVSGDMTVSEAAAGSPKVIGVALQTASAANDVIPVQLLGYVFRLQAASAVAAGDEVKAAANGQVQTAPATSFAATYSAADANAQVDNTRAIVGVALEAIAASAQGRVYVRR